MNSMESFLLVLSLFLKLMSRIPSLDGSKEPKSMRIADPCGLLCITLDPDTAIYCTI